MIAVVDYGVNNLKSVVRALAAGGHTATLTTDPDEVRGADRVLLPGVGNFGQASRTLEQTGLGGAVREVAAAGRPVMGICLGLQLFFEGSEEAPGARGLGLLAGRVRRFATSLPVPHVGWARVDLTGPGRRHAMLASLFSQGAEFFYHVHSYHPTAVAENAVLGIGEYGESFPTLVGEGVVVGAQFHPEKSQRAGMALLDAFARWRP
ncbi:MAG: imidazole glycerol phosphate synthase subunit HisH [Gemmatimonadales bacterium]|nr:imidazole glycerol phosphate synthase subunit HisH [Gemmatimonadales bacterium]MDQ3426525.1 imidazole glycerol phosphate synthase subunit HisH [Gemmatimonadota bacterium]